MRVGQTLYTQSRIWKEEENTSLSTWNLAKMAWYKNGWAPHLFHQSKINRTK